MHIMSSRNRRDHAYHELPSVQTVSNSPNPGDQYNNTLLRDMTTLASFRRIIRALLRSNSISLTVLAQHLLPISTTSFHSFLPRQLPTRGCKSGLGPGPTPWKRGLPQTARMPAFVQHYAYLSDCVFDLDR